MTVVAYLLAPKAVPGYDTAPTWIRVLVLASFPGTATLALRLVYEQTILTWRNGEQMVGFALAHAYTLFYLPMLFSFAVAHFALACVPSVTFARWLRRLPTPKWSWLVVSALAVCARVRTIQRLDDRDGQGCWPGRSRSEFPDDGGCR